MAKVITEHRFLEDSKSWSGAVEVLSSDDNSGQEHIYLRLRVGRVNIRLPRAGLLEVVDALHKAHAEAQTRYTELIKKMNRGK